MDPASTHGLWADLHRPDISSAEADFTVIGVPYDGAASARKGAALGPERIRFWSTHLTPFSEDRTRLGNIRVADLGDIAIDDQARDFEALRRKSRGSAQCSDHPRRGSLDQYLRSYRRSANATGISVWACCGWTHILICAMCLPVPDFLMPVCCGAHLNLASNLRMFVWWDCAPGRIRKLT